MTCLWCLWWCLWVFWIVFFSYSYFIDYMSTFKRPSYHSFASEWPSKVVWCHYRSCMMCLWCNCGAYDVPVMPMVVSVGFLDWLFFVFQFHWQYINIYKPFKSFMCIWMALKGLMMSLHIMHDVPLVCLWCIWRACDAYGGACGFPGLTFCRFPISLTTCPHLKALRTIHVHLNGL
jgi:hypothetical protein